MKKLLNVFCVLMLVLLLIDINYGRGVRRWTEVA